MVLTPERITFLRRRLTSRLRIASSRHPSETQCWIWGGNLLAWRGAVRIDKTHVRNPRQAAWIVFVGPIPTGMKVRMCTVERYCCNPKHLYLSKSGWVPVEEAKGCQGTTAKLTREMAARLLHLYGTGDFKMVQLAAMANVHQSTVSQLLTGRTYRDLPGPRFLRGRRVSLAEAVSHIEDPGAR